MKTFSQYITQKQSLYVKRSLLNGEEVRQWALSVGFKTTLEPEDMHCTIAFSRVPVSWDRARYQKAENILTITEPGRYIHQFNGGAVVLQFNSKILQDEWQNYRNIGCTWDFPEYKSHITISYNSDNININDIIPYNGPLILGPQIFSVVNEDWKNSIKEK